jgi:LPS export ABC transporter protein LptC
MRISRIIPALLAAAALCGCSDYGKLSQHIPTVQKIKDFTVYETAQSTRTWTLSSDLAEMTEGDPVARLTDPVMVYLKGQQSTVKSKQGFYDFDKKTVLLTGDVVAVSKKDAITLRTEALNYSPDRALVWTDAKVRLTQGGTVADGVGLEAKPDLSEIVLKHQRTKLGQ